MHKILPIGFISIFMFVGIWFIYHNFGNWGSPSDPFGGIFEVILGVGFCVMSIVGIVVVLFGKPASDSTIEKFNQDNNSQ
jgi:hypothetical protein